MMPFFLLPFTLALFLCAVSGQSLVVLLSEPDTQAVRSLHARKPGWASPYLNLSLDFADLSLLNLQRVSDGDVIRVGRVLDDFSSLFSSPNTFEYSLAGILPKNIGGHLAKEFVSPVYRPNRPLEDIVQSFRVKTDWIPFAQISKHSVKQLAHVQLPLQIQLLRLIEALRSVEAAEWKSIAGRGLNALSRSADIFGYMLDTTIPDSNGGTVHNNVNVTEDLLSALEKSFSTPLKEEAESRKAFPRAVWKHGFLPVYQALPKLTMNFRSILRTFNVPVEPPSQHAKAIEKARIVHVNPVKFVNFYCKLFTHVLNEYGINMGIDLHRVELDIPIETILGMFMDVVRLFYAMMQSAVERDAIEWLSAHPTSSYADYTQVVLSEMNRERFKKEDPLYDWLSLLFKDPRQLRIVERVAVDFMRFLETAIDRKLDTGMVIRCIRDIRNVKLYFPGNEKLASFLDLIYTDPSQMYAAVVQLLTGQKAKKAGIKEWAVGKIVSQFVSPAKILGRLVKLTDLRRNDLLVMKRVVQPLVGKKRADSWFPNSFIEQIPVQSEHSQEDPNVYLHRIWAALTQSSTTEFQLFDPDGTAIVYKLPTLEQAYRYLNERMELLGVDPAQIASTSDPLSYLPFSTLIRFGLKIAKYLSLRSRLTSSISNLVSPDPKTQSYVESELDAVFDDFEKSRTAYIMTAFYGNLPRLTSEGAQWRAQRQAYSEEQFREREQRYRELVKYGKEKHRVPWTLWRNVVRLVLLLSSLVMLWGVYMVSFYDAEGVLYIRGLALRIALHAAGAKKYVLMRTWGDRELDANQKVACEDDEIVASEDVMVSDGKEGEGHELKEE